MVEYVTGNWVIRESISGEVSLICNSGPGPTVSLMLTADYQELPLAQDLARVLNVSVAAIRIDGEG